MLAMQNLLNHVMWRLQSFSCWLCCRTPFVAHENFLFEVEREIVMWRCECMQTTVRQKKGKFSHIFSSHFPFFGKSKYTFSLSLCVSVSLILTLRKERKLVLKCHLVLTQIWLGNERFPLCVELPYIRSSLAIFSVIFSWEDNGWKTAEAQVSESDEKLGI